MKEDYLHEIKMTRRIQSKLNEGHENLDLLMDSEELEGWTMDASSSWSVKWVQNLSFHITVAAKSSEEHIIIFSILSQVKVDSI